MTQSSVKMAVITMRYFFPCELSLDVKKLRLKMIKHQLSHSNLRIIEDDAWERAVCS